MSLIFDHLHHITWEWDCSAWLPECHLRSLSKSVGCLLTWHEGSHAGLTIPKTCGCHSNQAAQGSGRDVGQQRLLHLLESIWQIWLLFSFNQSTKNFAASINPSSNSTHAHFGVPSLLTKGKHLLDKFNLAAEIMIAGLSIHFLLLFGMTGTSECFTKFFNMLKLCLSLFGSVFF
ncbi:hypothetical protein QQP08_025589 [Theobroma cacao]|nr:hypothetical protein QQP08_025589 [Theobroma cacao]